jgi:hypothetical protein
MAEPVRIVGGNRDGKTNEGIQALVSGAGSVHVREEDYVYSDVDKTDSMYYYYGAVNKDGEWKILRKTVGDPSAYRFCAGDSGYALAWTTRDSQTYDYYHLVF